MQKNQAPVQAESTQSSEALLNSILEHERTFRGVNWTEELFDSAGNEKPGFLEAKMRELTADNLPAAEVEQVVQEGLRLRSGLGATQLRSGLGATQQLGATSASEAINTIFLFEESTYCALREARDGDIKDQLLVLIKRLQRLEEDLKSGNMDSSLLTKVVSGSTLLSAGGVLFTGGAAVYGAAMLPVAMGATTTAAAVAALAAVAAVVAVVVAALVILALLMLKQAAEVHLVLNNTDYELHLYEVYCHNGKEVLRPRNKDYKCIIPARGKITTQNNKGQTNEEHVMYGGFFGFSKRDGALLGADGVIQFDLYDEAGNKHQTSTFLAYEVPLSGVFGGKNSCYARCSVGNPSAQEFFEQYEKELNKGHWEWTDQSGDIAIRKRIHDRSGSETFAITSYEQV